MSIEQKELGRMLETALVAARLAGQKAMEELGYIKSSVKYGTEIVTQADSICQKIIVDRIKEAYPDHGFIAEEGGGEEIFKQVPRGSEKFWWVIDPIDGTNNYAHGMLLFTVSIAVMYQGEPVVGVIFEPATDSMYSAVQGGDARLNNRKITASEDKLDKFASISLDSHFADGVPQWAQDIMLKTRYRNLGSTALHLCYVAKGSLAAAMLPNSSKIWDIAAGALICQAAGAVVTDLWGKDIFPIELDDYQKQGLNLVAANRVIHPEILEMLKK